LVKFDPIGARILPVTALWVAHDIRDAIMEFIAHWSERTEIGSLQLVGWIGLSRSKFYSWRDRYGEAIEHNALAPRDQWLEPWEKVAIISFHQEFPLAFSNDY
jgi:hypothetical protein